MHRCALTRDSAHLHTYKYDLQLDVVIRTRCICSRGLGRGCSLSAVIADGSFAADARESESSCAQDGESTTRDLPGATAKPILQFTVSGNRPVILSAY
jgi:hypothetical protein